MVVARRSWRERVSEMVSLAEEIRVMRVKAFDIGLGKLRRRVTVVR
jgi:hypothetical protein